MQKRKSSDNRPNVDISADAFLFMSEVPWRHFELLHDVEPSTFLSDEPGDRGPGPWLVERQPLGTPREFKLVAPLAEPALYADFAALDGKPDKDLRDFASAWGLLGDGQKLLLPGEDPRPVYIGESLGRWRQECRRLRLLVDLWNDTKPTAAGGHVDEGLRDRIVWHAGPPRRVDLEWEDRGRFSTIARERSFGDRGKNINALSTWTDDDRAGPARVFVCDEVNAALHGHASPAVLPFAKHELAIVPHDLLAALYVLFARHLTGRAPELRSCPQCGRNFFPSRSDKRFCSASCRKMHHYHDTKGAKL